MMELKRLLTRATALLLQGAYQGAESFIEQAMAEADKLKPELSELDTLRTRVTEMAAEVERLQSVIDEANAKKPVATIDVHFDTSDYEQDEERKLTYVFKGKTLERLGVGMHNLYANPIPAQQSIEQAHMAGQADAGIDPSYSNAQAYAISIGAQKSPSAEVQADCLSPTVPSSRRYGQPTERHMQSPAVSVPDETISEAFLRGYKEAAKEYTESPRITEQDARKIINEYIFYLDKVGEENCSIARFLDEGGRALIDKLNAGYDPMQLLETARGALADIASAKDLTLESVQRKANSIYRKIRKAMDGGANEKK